MRAREKDNADTRLSEFRMGHWVLRFGVHSSMESGVFGLMMCDDGARREDNHKKRVGEGGGALQMHFVDAKVQCGEMGLWVVE